MIYLDTKIEHEADFIELLEKTKKLTLKSLPKKDIDLSGDDFEDLTFSTMIKAAKGSLFEGHVQRTGPHGFPDIIAKRYFGAEVKVTKSNKWTSLGNSALESTRDQDVKRIYVFFGKLGGECDIRYRPYEDCMLDIAVTHSPRYRIDMNLPDGESIFDKMGISYDELRKENTIKKFKKYYISQLKEGDELWWIDQEDIENTSGPIIRQYRNLDMKLKERFVIATFSLFPEILSNSSSKFERSAAYLITHYNSVSPSLRDSFSAGGQIKLKIKNRERLIPRIYEKLFQEASKILIFINKTKKDELQYHWRIEKMKGTKIEQWKELIDKAANRLPKGIKASDIFEAGLAKNG